MVAAVSKVHVCVSAASQKLQVDPRRRQARLTMIIYTNRFRVMISRMKNCLPCVASAGAVLLALGACIGETGELPPPPAEIPAEMASAAQAFAANCASCHGEFARGSETGPPLVHPFYVPSHHGDAAFRFAIERGVAAHHWRFGDMPPQPQVQPAETEAIISYVRWLQREAGIE